MGGDEIQAQIVRYDVRGVGLVRNAVPFVILVTIAGKYISAYALVGAIVLQVAVIALFIKARTNLGRQTIRAKHESLVIVGAEQTIRQYTTIGWTLTARTARVYGPKYSYRLKVPAAQSDDLKGLLTQTLGPQIETKHRGSPRARMGALAVAIAGVTAMGAGIALELLPVALPGLVALLLGSATYGALSQRIAAAGRTTDR